MEEAFRREKEESDRLLRKQKLEYESKIVELQKQVMETSMSQSMLSSILSSSGLVESTLFQQQTLHEDLMETENDTLSCQFHSSLHQHENHLFLFYRLLMVGTRISISLVGLEKMAISSHDITSSMFSKS